MLAARFAPRSAPSRAAGGTPSRGRCDPRHRARLVDHGSDLFYYAARLLPNARISYVFKRETDAIRDSHNPLGTETVIFDADREFSATGRPLAVSELRMPEWELPRHLREPDPALRGSLERRVVSSLALGEVVFQSSTPTGMPSTYSMHNPQEGWDLRSDSARFWRKLERLGFTMNGGEAPDGDGWASWRNRADVMLRSLLATRAAVRE